MENEVEKQEFDYQLLNVSTNDEYFLKSKESSISTRSYQTVIANGLDLIEAKERVGHGAFTKWVEGCLGVDRFRASESMRIAKNFKCAESAHLKNMPKSTMVLLSSDTVSDETRQKALDIAASGEKVTLKISKELKEKDAETKDLQAKIRKPDIGNLIPALKQLYDDGKLLKSVAENYSQLSEDRQRVQLASEMSRIALLDKVSNFQSKVEDLERDLSEAEDNAEKTMMDKVANVTRRIEERTKEDIEATKTELEEVRKELAKANVNIRNELDKSIREEVEAKYRKDFEAAKRKEKDAMESMSAAHKKNDELEAENKRLIEQNGVINPTQIDNKWASMFDSKSKDVLEYIEIMKNEVSRAGGYPENAIESLNSMVKKINIQIDALEGNAIIEIERNLNV